MMASQQVVYILSKDPHLIEHLQSIDNAQFVTKAVNSLQALKEVACQGLVIVDVGCIRWGAQDWVRFFQEHLVLVASLKPTDSEGQQALVMGAKAYTHAYSSAEQWRRVLEHVLEGQVWLGASLLSRLLNQIATASTNQDTLWQQHLTAREIEVAQRAGRGFSNQQIAQDLDISERTVRAHLSSVFAKLNVEDRLSLALLIHGLLE